MRARLLDTTFERKFALLFGSVSVIILASTAAHVHDVRWALVWVLADLLLLAIRLVLMLRYERSSRSTKPPLGLLMLTGGIWAVVFGLGCYGCIATGNTALSVLAGLNVAGVLGVVTSRNAATPRFAVFVMLVVSLPYVIGAMMSDEPGMLVVGIQMPFYIVGVIVVLLQNHAIAARMIRTEMNSRSLALTDALTALPNRIALQERLRVMCANLGRGEAFAVLSMDLDGFKQVNDSHGHPVGDRLLRNVAERLKNTFRDGDMVSRVGGDEFVILLPNTTEIEASSLARRASERISAPFELGTGALAHIGVSIGGAFAPLDGTDADDLLNRSDLALYEAKRHGKGRYRAHMRQTG